MRGLAALVLTLCLMVSACGGDDPQPAPSPTKSPSPSETASDGSQPPPPPEASNARTKAGAAAFIRHYVAVLNYAGTTGNTQGLKLLAKPDCVRCKALTDGIDQVYAAGGEIKGGGWSVLRIKHYGFDAKRYFADVTIRSEPQQMVPSEGASPKEFPGTDRRLRAFVLEFDEDGWVVSELDPTA